MKPALRILALIVALVGLCAPSLSQGMGVSGAGWTAGHSDVAVATPTKIFGCKSVGGKRVLPCHPDQGVMSAIVAAAAPPAEAALSRHLLLPVATGAPEAELPPPRRS